MSNDKNIFGCFMKIGFDPNLTEYDFNYLAKSFTPYLWNQNGIDQILKELKQDDYGKDLELILFQFYVKPTVDERKRLKAIESYRKKEKAIGIPIIVTEENFFQKTETERYSFLKQSILQKLDLLAEVVKKKKLDTKIDLLKADLEKLLS